MKFITSKQFDEASFRRTPTARPECPAMPWGQWYCSSPDCVVREVEIACKLFDEPMPKVMRCPACNGALDFHHWIREEMVLR